MPEEIFSPKAMRIAIVSCTNGENSQYDSFNKTFHSRRRYSTMSDTDFHKDHFAAAIKFNEQSRTSNESNLVLCRLKRDSDVPSNTTNEIIPTVGPSEMEQLRSHFLKTDLRRSYSRSNSVSMITFSRGNSFNGNA